MRSTLTQKNKDFIYRLLDLRIHLSSRDNTKLIGLCQAASIHAEAFPDTIFCNISNTEKITFFSPTSSCYIAYTMSKGKRKTKIFA